MAASFKARSNDPILKIRFLVPKIGSRSSDGPISRLRFCGENVERSFVVCSHDPIFRSNKQSSIWRQNDQRYHAKFVSAFHLSRRVSDENGACSISIHFFKITDRCVGRSFSMCSHDPIFGTNKNRILKVDDYSYFFYIIFLRGQSSQHFTETFLQLMPLLSALLYASKQSIKQTPSIM